MKILSTDVGYNKQCFSLNHHWKLVCDESKVAANVYCSIIYWFVLVIRRPQYNNYCAALECNVMCEWFLTERYGLKTPPSIDFICILCYLGDVSLPQQFVWEFESEVRLECRWLIQNGCVWFNSTYSTQKWLENQTRVTLGNIQQCPTQIYILFQQNYRINSLNWWIFRMVIWNGQSDEQF